MRLPARAEVLGRAATIDELRPIMSVVDYIKPVAVDVGGARAFAGGHDIQYIRWIDAT